MVSILRQLTSSAPLNGIVCNGSKPAMTNLWLCSSFGTPTVPRDGDSSLICTTACSGLSCDITGSTMGNATLVVVRGRVLRSSNATASSGGSGEEGCCPIRLKTIVSCRSFLLCFSVSKSGAKRVCRSTMESTSPGGSRQPCYQPQDAIGQSVVSASRGLP
jgi:hypothetical protein